MEIAFYFVGGILLGFFSGRSLFFCEIKQLKYDMSIIEHEIKLYKSNCKSIGHNSD
jgi:hypothetical protein